MESRIRRFLLSKKDQSAEQSEQQQVQSIPYDKAPQAQHQPIFVYQSLGKSSREVRKNLRGDGFPLPSLSYENAQPGKAPVMGDRPQRGNGPVKLQTSRRLSNGELVATSEDADQTLQEIKEGDYVVGKKDKRLSQQPTSGQNPATANKRHSNLRSSCLVSSVPVNSYDTLPGSPPNKGLLRNSMSHHDKYTTHKSLGLSIPRSSMASAETWTPQSDRGLDSFDGGNATLKALWKAEYGRLAKIYSASRNSDIAKIDHVRWSMQLKSPLNQVSMEPTVPLDPLPKPSPDFIVNDSRRTSATSTCYESHADDNSDTSSHRPSSYTSSHAETTSQNARNSLEYDPVVAREDIRKMISQMRSTYISALDTQGSPPLKAKRTKKKRNGKLKPAATITTLDPPPASPSSADESSRMSNTSNKWRNSRPGSAVGRLSPIQASPSKNTTNSDLRLQRSDSTTLGNVLSRLDSPSDDARAFRRRSRKSRASTPSRSPHSRKTHDTLDRPITPSPSSGPYASWLLLDIDTANAVDAMLESPIGESPAFSSLPEPQQQLFLGHQKSSAEKNAKRISSAAYQNFLNASADELWPDTFKGDAKLGVDIDERSDQAARNTLPSSPPPPSRLPPLPPITK